MKRLIIKKLKRGIKENKRGKVVERKWGLASRLERVQNKARKK